MRYIALFAAILALAACGGSDDQTSSEKSKAASALDEQAIAAGLLPDPDNLSLAGQFETRSELGVDKFCATGSSGNFDIGVLAVFGPESKCEAQGSASLATDNINIRFRGEEECQFKAEYDGVEIRFPGALPESCDSYCTKRASFSGMVSPGEDAAKKTLGRDIDRLCG